MSNADILPNETLPIRRFSFQDVFSVEDQSKFGSELLDSWESIPEDFSQRDKQEYDLVSEKIDSNLFLHIPFDILVQDFNQSNGLESLLKKQTYYFGRIPENTFIEIDCIQPKEKIYQLITLVDYLKEMGFKTVIKGIGTESASLSLLSILKPNLIKIEMSDFSNWDIREFQTALQYLKDFSLNSGSSLFFSGISNLESLYCALDSGALLLQGNFLSEPSDLASDHELFTLFLREHIDKYHAEKRSKIAQEIGVETQLLNSLNHHDFVTKRIGNVVVLDVQSIFKISKYIRRIYLTDWTGTQISTYYERIGESGFRENKAFLGKNWSYLPFFYRHVKKAFRNQNQWILSEPYWDPYLKTQVTVFSRIIGSGYSLFLDVSLNES